MHSSKVAEFQLFCGPCEQLPPYFPLYRYKIVFMVAHPIRFGQKDFLPKQKLSKMSTLINPSYVRCIEACQQCLIDCQVCLTKMATKESMNDCPYCCLQCIESCQVCLKMMAADSQWAAAYCRLCAEICTYCAEQCGAHDHDHCQRCAESCRACAAACREVASAA